MSDGAATQAGWQGADPPIGIIAVTRQGAALAARLAHSLDVGLVVPARFSDLAGDMPQTVTCYHDSLLDEVRRCWTRYRQLVLIMASDVAVRAIAPLLDHKASDPAVICMDEAARWAIPLLDGHQAGANDLAGRIVAITNGQAVITTAVVRPPSSVETPGSCKPSHTRLSLISIGPGDLRLMIGAARDALNAAEIVIGYSGYIDQIRPLLRSDQEIVLSSLGDEVARAEQAVELAAAGRPVALISSGDIGIYAMAGPVFEVLRRRGWQGTAPEVEVFPGISAVQAAAARLGAPIAHDFCTISLSDLLTPWEVIERRLWAAARGDFVVALYNPRSRKRDWQLARAIEILRTCRSGDTPVAVARNVSRPDESIALSKISDLNPDSVDMFTLVLVGNSQSRLVGRYLATPRGYNLERGLEDRAAEPASAASITDETLARSAEARTAAEQGEPTTQAAGRAYLVGAGPGRAELITVRGLSLLRQADVVLYDHLIARSLLDQVPAGAERIFVGKSPDRHTLEQAMINDLLIEQARAGKRVVRLKGGDPFVFGRGGEEALALAEAGVPFEIVPGVSSALAVPAFAGIPVTHREVSTAFAVVAGHEAPGKRQSGVDWSALAHLPTLVILMGLKRLDAICAALIEAGRDPSTPAAVISWGTTDKQQVVRATLATLTDTVTAHPLPTPAVTVIGAVVALMDCLAWFQPDGQTPGFICSTD